MGGAGALAAPGFRIREVRDRMTSNHHQSAWASEGHRPFASQSPVDSGALPLIRSYATVVGLIITSIAKALIREAVRCAFSRCSFRRRPSIWNPSSSSPWRLHVGPSYLEWVACLVVFVFVGVLLAWMYDDQGARFRTFGCLAKGIVEEIVRDSCQSEK